MADHDDDHDCEQCPDKLLCPESPHYKGRPDIDQAYNKTSDEQQKICGELLTFLREKGCNILDAQAVLGGAIMELFQKMNIPPMEVLSMMTKLVMAAYGPAAVVGGILRMKAMDSMMRDPNNGGGTTH